MPSTDFPLHLVGAEDWRELKTLRLEMLADTPLAYLETLATAQAQPDENWQMRARRSAGPRNLQLVALDPSSRRWIGTMSCFFPDDRATLVAVYVTPPFRGRGGPADTMLDAVEAWVLEQGAGTLWLEVHEDNARAQAFYLRRGYADTGARVPYPLDESQQEIEMKRDLR